RHAPRRRWLCIAPQRKSVEVAELHVDRRDLIADDRRELPAQAGFGDRTGVVRDAIVIRRDADLDADAGERAHAIDEAHGRLERRSLREPEILSRSPPTRTCPSSEAPRWMSRGARSLSPTRLERSQELPSARRSIPRVPRCRLPRSRSARRERAREARHWDGP